MDDEVRRKLDEKIIDQFELLDYDYLRDEDRRGVIEDISKLYKLRIEESKTSEEDKKIDRYIRYGLELLGIVLPLCFYAKWMRIGLKFEETGTFTSQTFKGLLNRFRPSK